MAECSLYMIVDSGPCDKATGGGGIKCHGAGCIRAMETPFGGSYDGALLGDRTGFGGIG